MEELFKFKKKPTKNNNQKTPNKLHPKDITIKSFHGYFSVLADNGLNNTLLSALVLLAGWF